MTTLLLTFVLFTLAMLGMGIGQLLVGKPMRGGCGTHQATKRDPCDVCGKDEQCELHDLRHPPVER